MRNWLLILAIPAFLSAAINYDTLSANGWMQFRPTDEFPNRGGDVLGAIDTSGNFYMFGGCTYGNGAGGTHNNDIYRVDLNTGAGERLANCSNNVWSWKGGCQAGHAYDINRNCVWVTGGAAPVCGVGQNGLWKFQCPDGPFTRMNSDQGGKFLMYDNINDLLLKADQYKLNIYDCETNQWLPSANYPFSLGWEIYTWLVSCCFDKKRGLVVITMCDPIPNGTPRNDVYCYNPATGQWETKVPPSKPPFTRGSLAYDEVNDVYVYFGGGTCPAQVWTYSYDDNEWTEMSAGGRAYNEANPAASTWPPYRTQNTWNYSPSHNVFATWGTTEYVSDSTCMDDGIAMPFWFYRLDGSTDVKKPAADKAAVALTAEPNPFNASTIISIGAKLQVTSCKLSIFDIRGNNLRTCNLKLETERNVTLNAAGLPAGLYLVRVRAGAAILEKKITLLK